MIAVTPAVAAKLVSDHAFAHLLKMELTSGTLCFTDAGYDITFNGETYLANGLVQSIEAPKFTTELRVGEISISMSAVDQSMVALLLGTSQVNRYVHIYKAILDDSIQIIPDPILLHSWLITDVSIAGDAKTADVSISMASEWADFEAPRGRRTTDASQRRFYPSDKGFEFAAQVKKELKWGGE